MNRPPGYAAFWTASSDGSSWYRADQPAAALGWRGHKTWVSEVLPATVASRAQAIVGSRVSLEGPSQTWAELAGRSDGPRLILDLDDDYFGVEKRNENAYRYWSRPDVQDRLRANCRLADAIVVASERIGEAVVENALNLGSGLTQKWPEIVVIENGLHAGLLSVPRDYDPEVLTIGWAGTSATAHDFDLVAPALDKIMEYCGRVGREAKLALIGLPVSNPWLRKLGERWPVEHAEWVAPTERYHSAVFPFDIWVAPYRGNSFTDAKFPTKALEAGFMGIPLIASDIVPYRGWAPPGGGILTVPEHQPWLWGRYLKALVDSPETRRTMGEAARSRAALNILQDRASQWEDVLFGA